MRRQILFFSFMLLLFNSCKQINKVTDLVKNPTAKELYQKNFNVSSELFELWQDQVDLALRDSIFIELPYQEIGSFTPRSFPVYSYNISLNAGELLDVRVKPDHKKDLVFLELFLSQNDSMQSFSKIAGSEYKANALVKEIEQTGTYKIVIQPEIAASSDFSLEIKSSPVYRFPVAGVKNTAVQSLWGAARDGGRRSHEGIDIFAKRGTPVIAATNGRITFTGEKGLGGKQVWLRDAKRGQSLYYAHLDSIAQLPTSSVNRGDTIGFVGNTGNAKTTPPHLHFGIYTGYRGAIDPLYHVYQLDEPQFDTIIDAPEATLLAAKSKGNLRSRPSSTKKSEIIGNISPGDTLRFLGKTRDWFHVRTTNKKAAFIHESLIAPL